MCGSPKKNRKGKRQRDATKVAIAREDLTKFIEMQVEAESDVYCETPSAVDVGVVDAVEEPPTVGPTFGDIVYAAYTSSMSDHNDEQAWREHCCGGQEWCDYTWPPATPLVFGDAILSDKELGDVIGRA